MTMLQLQQYTCTRVLEYSSIEYLSNLAGLTGADLAAMLFKAPAEDWQGGKRELVEDYELRKPHANTLLRAFALRLGGAS